MKARSRLPHRQKGIALVLFAASLAVLIGVAGLALDLSHVMLNDSRLQNAMDACALSGARVMMDTKGNASAKISAATSAAKNTFMENANHGLSKINQSDISVVFSDTLENFGASVTTPRYISCSVGNYSVTTSLVRIFGIDDLGLDVTAVAGVIPITNCNPAPLLVCGIPDEKCEFGSDTCYGFNVYKEDKNGNPTSPEEKCYLKSCPPGANCSDMGPVGESCGAQAGAPTGGGSQVADVSAGNFQLLDYTCASGKKGVPCIKEAFEEGGGAIVGGCPEDGSIVTSEPGNVASVIKSFNSIFDGPNIDTNPTEPLFFSDYNNGRPTKGNGRRELGVVIGDCSDPMVKPGKTPVPVLTVGCFFATDRGVMTGGKQLIWGQFIGQCSGSGNITKTPNAFDTFKIVLYKDHGGPDS